MNDYSTYIAKSRYAKYLPEEKRRETWGETVDRYITHVAAPKVAAIAEPEDFAKAVGYLDTLSAAIKDQEVLPSMRALMTAGPALDRDHTSGYNCAYMPVQGIDDFAETMHNLMSGTGQGYSVERQYVSCLPTIHSQLQEPDAGDRGLIVVEDSKDGWSEALRKLLTELYSGTIPEYDLSLIRPKGARLKTFGGRASGPEPLDKLFKFIIKTFKAAQGRKLNSLEAHDIMCMIGECVVSGGVRRSALISLSNLSDDRMRHAKDLGYHVTAPFRGIANNSVAYTEKPDFPAFLREMTALFESRNGERGIFFRKAADKQATSSGRREGGWDWGTNPCSEIILRPYQFCNLTSVVVRPDDNLEDLLRKVELAAILGTIQASLTNFKFLRPIWKENAEKEALLGVSLTGMMDHPVLQKTGATFSYDDYGRVTNIENAAEWLHQMKEKANETNKRWASYLGINQAAATTCIKPEGTVSQLTDSASGLHTRWSPFYIRRVRADKTDPLSAFMEMQGVPVEEDLFNPNTLVLSFPMKAPAGAIFRNNRTAIEQLEYWKMIQDAWTEHKPSVTVYYSDDEFLGMAQWVWDNFDDISGISFLPRDDIAYDQAPYEEITEAQYTKLMEEFPAMIHWNAFFEEEDNTTSSQTLACVGTNCEVI